MSHPSDATRDIEYVVEPIQTDAVQVQPGFFGMKTMAPDRPISAPATPVTPKTADGLDTQMIIGRWSSWMHEKTGIIVPSGTRARLGKQVRTLIMDRYDSHVIIWALSIWSLKAAEVGPTKFPPEQLGGLAWKFAMDASDIAKRWRADMTDAVRNISARTGVSTGLETKTEIRQQTTANALDELRARKAKQ
ncbi:hypothetical protein GCM10025867_47680 (plasmid) [Frondihabitans sucicola]|uniref:Uncharacterized protein n=1 Tax=Frondihabitans sucicola TaxID=1268041 RepID=A0ABM8GVM3_9MICO|nr:hypothetical protein [Frondihabitans sucicola]BDZ52527.1 hypothetical protein GCM10025867_47680 [Frondihabitans sucicola]